MNTTPFSTLHFFSTADSGRPRSDQDQLQVDATRLVRAAGQRALVLGGGGATGNAWLVGVIAGLCDGGLDVTEADLIIGTSAGSTAAAQITSASRPSCLPTSFPLRPSNGLVQSDPTVDAVPWGRWPTTCEGRARSSPPLRMQATCAAEWARGLYLDAASDGSRQTQWRATVAARLPSQHWPQLRCSSRRSMPIPVNRWCSTATAESAWWTPLPPAVPVALPTASATTDSSTAATGSSENADLAAGHARVLVLSPLGGRSWAPLEWSTHLSAQVDELRARGSKVETIFPDSTSEHMFGADAMDLSLRPPAARAGYDQGRAHAEQLTEFWRR